MAIKSIEKNSYELSLADVSWIYQNSNGSAKRLIQGLLQRKFDNSEKLFTDERDLAKACIEFARTNSYEFQDNSIDRSRYESLINTDLSDPDKIIESFRILWRGYEDKDLTAMEKGIQRNKIHLKKLLDQAVKRNNVLLRAAGRKGKEIKKTLYQENMQHLQKLEHEIDEAFKNPKDLVIQKLSYSVSYRRKKYLAFLGFLPDDYTSIEYRIVRQYNPDDLTFPLRFLLQIPVRVYYQLRKEWHKGVSRDDLILMLEKIVRRTNFFAFLLGMNDKLKFVIRDRTYSIEEMHTTLKKNCFLANTLLGVTQTEGILWDFARYLNRRNIRIFKTLGRHKQRYHPYEWNYLKGRYRTYKPTMRPKYNKRIKLTSVRQVLLNTRMGSIIPPELYSYLIDEFYDDRIKIAHGEITDRNFNADAIAAMLCFGTSLSAIESYLSKKGLVKETGWVLM